MADKAWNHSVGFHYFPGLIEPPLTLAWKLRLSSADFDGHCIGGKEGVVWIQNKRTELHQVRLADGKVISKLSTPGQETGMISATPDVNWAYTWRANKKKDFGHGTLLAMRLTDGTCLECNMPEFNGFRTVSHLTDWRCVASILEWGIIDLERREYLPVLASDGTIYSSEHLALVSTNGKYSCMDLTTGEVLRQLPERVYWTRLAGKIALWEMEVAGRKRVHSYDLMTGTLLNWDIDPAGCKSLQYGLYSWHFVMTPTRVFMLTDDPTGQRGFGKKLLRAYELPSGKLLWEGDGSNCLYYPVASANYLWSLERLDDLTKLAPNGKLPIKLVARSQATGKIVWETFTEARGSFDFVDLEAVTDESVLLRFSRPGRWLYCYRMAGQGAVSAPVAAAVEISRPAPAVAAVEREVLIEQADADTHAKILLRSQGQTQLVVELPKPAGLELSQASVSADGQVFAYILTLKDLEQTLLVGTVAEPAKWEVARAHPEEGLEEIALSPDGRRLAFTDKFDYNQAQLKLASWRGKKVKVVSLPCEASMPAGLAWLNNRRLLYHDGEDGEESFVIDVITLKPILGDEDEE